MNESSNEKLLNAWENFQRVFHKSIDETNTIDKKKLKPFMGFTSAARPKTAKSYKSQKSLPRPPSGQIQVSSPHYISNMISFKSLLNLKACSRQSTRPSTAIPKSQSKHFEILNSISENKFQEIVKKAEKIHSLQTDEILDIYTAKCKDQEVEYLPEQAVVFIEKFKLNCGRKRFYLADLNLGLESAIIIGRILSENNYFSRVELPKNLLSNAGAIVLADSIKHNFNIMHLDLTSNSIGVEGAHAVFGVLLENESIVSLNLSSYEGLNRNRLGNKGIEPLEIVLKSNKTLQFLHLANIGITVDGLKCLEIGLKGNRNLTLLDISGNDLGWVSASTINNILSNSQINELLVSRNNFGDRGIDILSRSFKPNLKLPLNKLDLAENNISSQGISKFLDVLAKNPSIVELDISNNNFSGKGIGNLQGFLSENTSVTKLSLKNCNIEAEGALAIGAGLAKNNLLKELNISGNFIRDSGTKAIANSLTVACKKLVSLDLSKNRISDQGCLALINAIYESQTIKFLYLKENNIHDESGMQMVFLVKQYQGILKLSVSRNAISYKYLEEIKKSIQQNNAQLQKQKAPSYLNKMLELREFQGQKLIISKESEELYRAEKGILTDIDDLKADLERTKIEENSKTEKFEKELEVELSKLKEFELTREAKEKETMDFNMDCDVESKQKSSAIGNLSSQTAMMEIELKKTRDEFQANKLSNKNLIESLKNEFSESSRLAQIAEAGFNTFHIRVSELKSKIEQYTNSYNQLVTEGYSPKTRKNDSNKELDLKEEIIPEENQILLKKKGKKKKKSKSKPKTKK